MGREKREADAHVAVHERTGLPTEMQAHERGVGYRQQHCTRGTQHSQRALLHLPHFIDLEVARNLAHALHDALNDMFASFTIKVSPSGPFELLNSLWSASTCTLPVAVDRSS